MRCFVPWLLLLCACARGPAAPGAAPPPVVASPELSLALLQRRVTLEARRHPDEAAPALVARVASEELDALTARAYGAAHGLVVDARMIDAGIDAVASATGLTRADVLAEAARHGLDEAEYRHFVEDQVWLRVVWRSGPGSKPPPSLDTDAKRQAALDATYATWKRDPRHFTVRVRILALREAPNVDARLSKLRQRAEAGEDFCALVQHESDDPRTRDDCGDSGALPIESLAPALRAVVQPLHRGAFARATVDAAHVLVQVVDPLGPQPLEDVADQLWRDTAERIDDAERARWLRARRAELGLDWTLSDADRQTLEAAVAAARKR